MIKIYTSQFEFLSLLLIEDNFINMVFGAGVFGKKFLSSRLAKIDYFIDSGARDIKFIEDIPVILLKEVLQTIEQADVSNVNIVLAINDEAGNNTMLRLINEALSSFEGTINVLSLWGKLHWVNRQISGKYIYKGYEHLEEYKKQGLPYIYNLQSNSKLVATKTHLQYADFTSPTENYSNGIRETIRIKDTYKSNLYLIGDSRIRGLYVEDKHTISSQLQSLFDINNYDIGVYNFGKGGVANDGISALIADLKTLHLQPNDIVIFSSSLFTPIKEVYTNEKSILYLANELNNIKQYCQSYNTKFYYGAFPFLIEKSTFTSLETNLLNAELLNYFKWENNINTITSKLQTLNTLLRKACNINEVPYINFHDIFLEPNLDEKIFIDRLHFSPKANEVLAKIIFDHIKLQLELENSIEQSNSYMQKEAQEFQTFVFTKYHAHEWHSYINKLKEDFPSNSGIIGAVVVNCNPFTLGHKFLIETASSNVDKLFVFVVEEDKSVYTFEQRFTLVQQNLKHLSNVEILPSGKFIISQVTFPEYFTKDNLDNSVDVANDLTIFANEIAPVLNISKRFVGHEPHCKVTNGYNESMKKILPQYGIELVEIERKEIGGEVISASKVRKCIEDNNFELLQTLVPDATYEFLCKQQIIN
ncbi:MAG: hypothetical protein ATN36_07060 [Epulopiscium sp. Nele67-Bin005]|nr:MAG: hypothetical protein ATN36_07060 [Epulopiscium sp. Nele67-Bin005]